MEAMRYKTQWLIQELGGGGIRCEGVGGGGGGSCKLTYRVRLCPICLCICGVSAFKIS